MFGKVVLIWLIILERMRPFYPTLRMIDLGVQFERFLLCQIDVTDLILSHHYHKIQLRDGSMVCNLLTILENHFLLAKHLGKYLLKEPQRLELNTNHLAHRDTFVPLYQAIDQCHILTLDLPKMEG